MEKLEEMSFIMYMNLSMKKIERKAKDKITFYGEVMNYVDDSIGIYVERNKRNVLKWADALSSSERLRIETEYQFTQESLEMNEREYKELLGHFLLNDIYMNNGGRLYTDECERMFWEAERV